MSDILDPKILGSTRQMISRRDFIKGVIAGGVAVSSAGYLFRASTSSWHRPAPRYGA